MKIRLTTLILLVAFGVGLSSCKKDKKEAPAANGSWKVENKSYSQKNSIAMEDTDEFMLMAYDDDTYTSGNACMAVFKHRPTASGTYKIKLTDNSDELANDQVAILFTEKIGGVAYAALAKDGNATVTVSGGKVKVSVGTVNGIKAQPDVPGTEKNITVSASISEE